MSWHGDTGRRRGLSAARRRTALSPRVLGRLLPWRRACCQEAPVPESLFQSRGPTPQRVDGLLEGFCPEPRAEEQFAANSKGRLLLLRVADIDWLEAADDCVAVHVGAETHLLASPLSAVMAKLPAGRFLRISLSALVNVRQIKDLRPMCQSEWQVLLRNGTRLILTRGYGEHLRQAGWFLTAPAKPLVRSNSRSTRPIGGAA